MSYRRRRRTRPSATLERLRDWRLPGLNELLEEPEEEEELTDAAKTRLGERANALRASVTPPFLARAGGAA